MSITRRGFLAGVGAGIAGLSTAEGYRKLIPFVSPVEELVPGVATWYASACRECPSGCGVLLRNREARIVKAEGNPLHPVNAGRLCARGQAALQGLYDPDRIPRPRRRAASGEWQDVPWEAALAEVGKLLSGARVGFISDLQSGSLAHLVRRWVQALGGTEADLLVYEPLNYEALRVANRTVFGTDAIPDYHVERADLLLSFGADFLETWLSPVLLTRRFTEMRQVRKGKRARFVYVGPRRSMTAAQADEVILLPPAQAAFFAVALAALAAPEGGAKQGVELAGRLAGFMDRPLETLKRLAGEVRAATAPLALAGSALPYDEYGPAAAVAAQAINRRSPDLLDFGRAHALGQTATLDRQRAFLRRAAAGEFDAIVILGANPLYSMPPEMKAAEALGKAKRVVCLNSFADETVAGAAGWALPVNAPAESWGDYEPARGIRTLMQPAMGTTFDSREAGDVLLQLARAAGVPPATFGAESYYDYLRNRWRDLQREAGHTGDFEGFWRTSMEAGGLTLPAPAPALREDLRTTSVKLPNPGSHGTKLYIHPSLRFLDGRHANKPWLQEIPDPMTGAVWGSWVELHPDTARRLGIAAGDPVELVRAGVTCRLPAHVWDGVAPGIAALALGQGHTAYGRTAAGVGVNAFTLLAAPGEAPGVALRRLDGPGDHVIAHGDPDQHGREIAQCVALANLAAARPGPVDLPTPAGYQRDRDVYRGHDHPDHRWVMVVDLDRCNGCGACVAACYAENNVPVVGKREVRRRHQMPWIRIDRYEERTADGATRVLFQPMMCQHCDAAPCESVCPAYATVHSPEGLNEQIYNRCVGTRYCNNNCPYKVRRFNWFNFEWPEPLNYQLNPDVTVRERGVMEKCTFCVQRIKEVTIQAKAEGRSIKDGEITPACAQTCPTGAILFGDLKDPGSRVARIIASDPRRYQVLRELNTKPGVFYLKRIVG